MNTTQQSTSGTANESLRRRPRITAVVLLASAALFGFVVAQRDASGQAKASVSIEQCANGNSTCSAADPSNWITGNLNRNNSSYPEGSSVPYRAIVSGLAVGQTYAIRIEFDSTESTHHALDYLTNFDRTEAAADPCSGVVCGAGPVTLSIPADPNVVAAGVTPAGGQAIHAWGATFTGSGTTVGNTGNLCSGPTCTIGANPSSYFLSGTYAGSSQTSLEVYFTATETSAVLSWGGHVATQSDWGVGMSASALSGSPYHMRVIDFRCSDASNCGVGNQDLSMSSTAVESPTTTTTTPGTTTTSTPGTTTTTTPGTTTTTQAGTTTTAAPTTNPGAIFFPTQIPEVTQGSETTRTLPPNEDSDGPDGVGAEEATSSTLPATGAGSTSTTLLGLALVCFAVAGFVLLAVRPVGRREE